MPLCTQIIRDGKELPIHWGGFHVAAMTIAAVVDQPVDEWKIWENPVETAAEIQANGYPDTPMPVSPGMVFNLMSYPVIGATPLNEGSVTLTKTHRFIDVTDGEVLELLPGDVLRCWRDF